MTTTRHHAVEIGFVPLVPRDIATAFERRSPLINRDNRGTKSGQDRDKAHTGQRDRGYITPVPLSLSGKERGKLHA